uniref:Uncharacterized protein n=1 Tax=Arundo donax TaxID=35708 RepID=A0A0A8ZZV5_ARUDO
MLFTFPRAMQFKCFQFGELTDMLPGIPA